MQIKLNKNMTRKELKEKIPYGYIKIIALKAGVSTHSVSLFLSEKTNSTKVELAALEVVSDLEQKKRTFINQIV
jgi:hypothetical protein